MSNSQAFWKPHIEAWQTSGLSQAEYARQNQLPPKLFNYHKRRHFKDLNASTSTGKTAGGTSLIPVMVTDQAPKAPSKQPGISLVSSGGVRVELAAGFDPTALRQVLSILEAS